MTRLLSLNGHSQALTQPLQLRISSDKDIYELGEEIEFTAIFQNTSQEDRHIYVSEFYRATLFCVSNELGMKAATAVTAMYDVMWSPSSYKIIKAGDDYKWRMKANIREEEEITIDFKDSIIILPRLGKHKISVEYEGWDGITTNENGDQIAISEKFGFVNVFTGTLVSNTVEIEIKQSCPTTACT